VLVNGWLTRTLRLVALLALPALVLLPVLAHHDDTYRPSWVIAAGTGLTVVLLIGVLLRPRSGVGRLLSSPPMRWLGERSYSIYLWNVMIRIGVISRYGHTHRGDLVWIAIIVVLGEASYRFVERPLRAKLSGRRPTSDPPSLGPAGTPTARVA
jgi:peptidoglycan/LPS O-acetylase OafA/YrhL